MGCGGRTIRTTVGLDGLCNNTTQAAQAHISGTLARIGHGSCARIHILYMQDRTPETHTGIGIPTEGEVDEDENGELVAPPVVDLVRTH
jgi:hypothetical protein